MPRYDRETSFAVWDDSDALLRIRALRDPNSPNYDLGLYAEIDHSLRSMFRDGPPTGSQLAMDNNTVAEGFTVHVIPVSVLETTRFLAAVAWNDDAREAILLAVEFLEDEFPGLIDALEYKKSILRSEAEKYFAEFTVANRLE
jgi:hypothetical protein